MRNKELVRLADEAEDKRPQGILNEKLSTQSAYQVRKGVDRAEESGRSLLRPDMAINGGMLSRAAREWQKAERTGKHPSNLAEETTGYTEIAGGILCTANSLFYDLQAGQAACSYRCKAGPHSKRFHRRPYTAGSGRNLLLRNFQHFSQHALGAGRFHPGPPGISPFDMQYGSGSQLAPNIA